MSGAGPCYVRHQPYISRAATTMQNRFRCPIFPLSRSQNAGPPSIPTGSSSIRCRRRTASRSRSCWRRSDCPMRCIWSTSTRTIRRRRNFCRSIRTARSRRSSIRTGLAASRCRCSSPARSCNISRTRPASSCLTIRRGVTRRSSGCTSRWAGSDRCSARSAFSTNSPARIFADKRPLERYVAEFETPARGPGDAACRTAVDHG